MLCCSWRSAGAMEAHGKGEAEHGQQRPELGQVRKGCLPSLQSSSGGSTFPSLFLKTQQIKHHGHFKN